MGCAGDVDLHDSGYNNSVSLFGLYIVLAFLIYAPNMSYNIFTGIRHAKLWFPPNYFSLNSITITLINIVTKLSFDSTTMMGRVDQIYKLSGMALLATAIAHFFTSLGDTSNATSNIFSVGIIMVTVTFCTIFQIGADVIHIFVDEHIAILVLILLLVLCSFVVAILTTKNLIEIIICMKSHCRTSLPTL